MAEEPVRADINDVKEEIENLKEHNESLRQQLDNLLTHLGISKLDYRSFRQSGKLRTPLGYQLLTKEVVATKEEITEERELREEAERILEQQEDEIDRLYDMVSEVNEENEDSDLDFS